MLIKTPQWFAGIKGVRQKRIAILVISLLIALIGLGIASMLITVVEPIKAAIANGIIVAWPSTNVSIPAGWTRITDLDDTYTKGTAVSTNPNNTGGSATHTHTSPGHGHGSIAHTHGGGGATGASGTNTRKVTFESGNEEVSPAAHTHIKATVPSGSTTISTKVATWQAENNDPSYFDVIYIQSDGTPAGFPDNSIAFYNSSTPPIDWIQHVGSKDRFLKGATVAGDGGGTGGGAHTHTANSHNHSLTSHSHGSTITAGDIDNLPGEFGAGIGKATPGHTHLQTHTTSGGTSSNVTSGITGSTTYEPPFHTLLVIENNKGATSLPNGTIAMWLGTLSNIPTDWVLCDGLGSCSPDLQDKFVKAANIGSDVGTTGGSDGHDHTDPSSHTHTINHTHLVTINSTGSTEVEQTGSGTLPPTIHSHSGGSTANPSPNTSNAGTQTVDTTADTQPPFRTVAYIKCVGCSPSQRRILLINHIMPFLPPVDQGTVIGLLAIIMASLLGYFTFNALAGATSLRRSRNVSLT